MKLTTQKFDNIRPDGALMDSDGKVIECLCITPFITRSSDSGNCCDSLFCNCEPSWNVVVSFGYDYKNKSITCIVVQFDDEEEFMSFTLDGVKAIASPYLSLNPN